MPEKQDQGVMPWAAITPFDLLRLAAHSRGEARALAINGTTVSFTGLLNESVTARNCLRDLGVGQGERVATYSEKTVQSVALMFGAWSLGAMVVPVNPLLKPEQVLHVLHDSEASVLWTTEARRRRMHKAAGMPDRLSVVTDYVDACGISGGLPNLQSRPHPSPPPLNGGGGQHNAAPCLSPSPVQRGRVGVGASELTPTDNDPAAILYTSGSTGLPKGVVLSNRNILSGAQSVATYLQWNATDVVLGILPLSFDAGLSQLMAALVSGACYAGLDYLLPAEVPALCQWTGVTTITAVPPLWAQLMEAHWSAATAAQVRSFANTGGHMPKQLLNRLRRTFSNARPYLMYGFTEAFRSTYLDPEEIDRRPDSIGKAVPNADVRVLRPDGSECAADEPGELVHRGSFVTLGYWKDPQRTQEKFRVLPSFDGKLPRAEIAAWSGDIVRRDADGYLYYVGRVDLLMKVMGHRISPLEIENAVYASGMVKEVAAYGIPVPVLGHHLVVSVVPVDESSFTPTVLLQFLREKVASYMVPRQIVVHAALPRNANGKIDITALQRDCSVQEQFSGKLLQEQEG